MKEHSEPSERLKIGRRALVFGGVAAMGTFTFGAVDRALARLETPGIQVFMARVKELWKKDEEAQKFLKSLSEPQVDAFVSALVATIVQSPSVKSQEQPDFFTAVAESGFADRCTRAAWTMCIEPRCQPLNQEQIDAMGKVLNSMSHTFGRMARPRALGA